MKKTVVLAILDGWGVGKKNESNPIHVANLPTIKYIEDNFPVFGLKAAGVSVGLPWDGKGDSEVGHLTIGAGRIVEQYFMRITKSIENGDFFNNETLKNLFLHAKKNGSCVHFVGILTEGTFHSSIDHIKALLNMAGKEGVNKVFLQLFSDGKDSSPKSVGRALKEVEKYIAEEGIGTIASVTGRYLAMDNEENWERTERAYGALLGRGINQPASKSAENAYFKGLSDAYIEPTILNSGPIKENDAVLFFNFRDDGIRQILAPFVNKDFGEFPTEKFENLFIATMAKHENNFSVPSAFTRKKIEKTLGEIISSEGKTQLRIAEQEKWPHVTTFFNGLRKESFENEYRIMIPSEKMGRPENNPEMQASAITERAVASLQEGGFDFILLNYANADTISHTGNFSAAIRAVQAIDRGLNKIIRAIIASDHILIITSDHGNAELLLDPITGTAKTEHTTNPVPLYIVGNGFVQKNSEESKFSTLGTLSDVAPTILHIMGIPKPEEMTGYNLLDKL